MSGNLFIGDSAVIDGIPLPSDTPLFLTIVFVHVAAGLIAVIAGVVAMLSPKQVGGHPKVGKFYYWALSIVFITMTILAILRWAEDYHLLILGALSFMAATIGRAAKRKQWSSWVRIHMTGMGLSYIFMITAFYVDNGPNLPLWHYLPTIVLWILPGLIGLPILVNALFRHPLTLLQKSNRSAVPRH